MTPDAVHQLSLVAANLEGVVLAELVENPRGAVTEFLAGFAGCRILNLVSLEHLLGLGSLGNGLSEDVLEEVLHAPRHEDADVLLEIGVKLVLGDEAVDAGLDRSHFEGFAYENSENGLLLLIPFV